MSKQGSPTGFAYVDASVSQQVSPIGSGTSEITFKFPPGSSGINLRLPSNAGQLRKVAGGLTGGYVAIKADTWFYAPGVVGDIVYVSRDGATTIEFSFDK